MHTSKNCYFFLLSQKEFIKSFFLRKPNSNFFENQIILISNIIYLSPNKISMFTIISKSNYITKYIVGIQLFSVPYHYPLLTLQLKLKSCFKTKKQQTISINEHKDAIHIQPNTEILVDNSRRIIREYPFITIPKYYIDKFQQLPIQPTIARDVVAFICLSTSKEQIHKIAFKIMFPERAKYIAFDRQTFQKGRQIFTEYFQIRQNQFITTINDTKASLEERISALNILVQFTVSQTLSNHILTLNQSIITQQQSGTLLVLYVHLLIKHKKPYQKYLPILTSKLNNQQLQIKQRISIIKSLISIPNFITIIPNSLINLTIKIIKSQLQILSNQQIIRIISMLFNYKSAEGTLLSIELQKFITELNPEKEPSRAQLFLKLTSKVIKYSTAILLSSQKFVADFINNINKYEPYLKHNNLTKQNAISSLFLSLSEDLNPELIKVFRAHIFQIVSSLSKNPQYVENQIHTILKLIKSHSKWLTITDQQTLKIFLIKQVLPKFQNDLNVVYESLIMILEPKSIQSNSSYSANENSNTTNKQKQKYTPFSVSENQQIIKYINLYFSKTCSKNNVNQLRIHSKVCELIQLLLLLSKTNLQIQQSNLPQICKYPFTIKDFPNLSTLQQLIDYLTQLNESKNEDILSTLNNIYPVIQWYINKKYLRFRSALSLIELAHRCKFQNKYFYFKIEDMLFQLMNKNHNFYLTTHNIYIIKDKFLTHMKSGSNLETLIYQTLKSPSSWDSNKLKYLDSEKRRRNKTKTRQEQQKRKDNNLYREQ